MLGGAFVVELSTIGRVSDSSRCRRSTLATFPVVQGVVMAVATVFVLANLLVDIAYAYLNPRIRLGVDQ